eukprot:185590-Pelagomonas_calceolata.AAC.1
MVCSLSALPTPQAPRRLVSQRGASGSGSGTAASGSGSRASARSEQQPEADLQQDQHQAKKRKGSSSGGSCDWRSLMEPTRRAAARLCDEGVLQATQKGQVSVGGYNRSKKAFAHGDRMLA